MNSVQLSETPSLKFEKSEVVWSLKDRSPVLWGEFLKADSSARGLFESFSTKEHFPVAQVLDPFVEPWGIRPRGSVRAYYLTAASGGVLTIKGSEIMSPHFKRDSQAQLIRKLPGFRPPWTMSERFLFVEQKLPYVVTCHEAISEGQISMEYQESHFKTFGALAMSPLPLMVTRWPKAVESGYLDLLRPMLRPRGMELSEILLREKGLGLYIYYFPHMPYRIAYNTPPNVTSYPARSAAVAPPLAGASPSASLEAIDNLLNTVTKMLVTGYFPLSKESHGTGQCIAAQNVTLSGGIVDMDSLFRIDAVRSDQEFYELFMSMLIVLTSTVKVFQVIPLPVLEFEFAEPSGTSILVSNFIWEKLRLKFEEISKGRSVDPRLKALLQKGSALELDSILTKLYPPNDAPRWKHLGPYEKGGTRF